VFAGYGLKPRNSEEVGYDSYAGLDVKDKIVLVLRYSPSDADSDLKSKLERASALRVKALVARQQGAKGIIIFGGPRSEHAGELINLGFEVGGAGSGIIGLSTTGDLADALFKTVGKKCRRSAARIRHRESPRGWIRVPERKTENQSEP
jgi:hypothetical protein